MKTLIAMSGGIDSTAAALLLQEQGYELLGCTFRTRYTSEASLQAAQQLAKQLGIEHFILDLDEEFEREIVGYFRHEYLAGRTPNPCIQCNKTIKFGRLLDEAHQRGCDTIATGHYARIVHNEQGYFLARAKDSTKDQTYFLWQLSEQQLAHTLFPLGDYTKAEIRAYLQSKGYTSLAHQGESQDICFIHDDYRSFLQLPPQPGNYLNKEGQIVGQHIGYTSYTIGQRKGLGIALGKPAFVTAINAQTNEVRVGDYEDLLRTEIPLPNALFRGDESRPILAQIRYRSRPTEAWMQTGPTPILRFQQPVWAVTPGQSVVMYQDDLLVGGGCI